MGIEKKNYLSISGYNAAIGSNLSDGSVLKTGQCSFVQWSYGCRLLIQPVCRKESMTCEETKLWKKK